MLPPGAHAQFPAYDGDPFFVSLPVHQVNAVTATEVRDQVILPILKAVGFERGMNGLAMPPTNGLNQPVGPLRTTFLIQKALELCGEVKALGNALLGAWEKGDGEQLAVMRQKHEVALQERTQETLYSDYKEVGGVKHSMKLVINRDREKYVESEITDFETKEKIDDAVFAKP